MSVNEYTYQMQNLWKRKVFHVTVPLRSLSLQGALRSPNNRQLLNTEQYRLFTVCCTLHTQKHTM